jgi:hypothetical protein
MEKDGSFNRDGLGVHKGFWYDLVEYNHAQLKERNETKLRLVAQ